jgi:hypothetical protein
MHSLRALDACQARSTLHSCLQAPPWCRRACAALPRHMVTAAGCTDSVVYTRASYSHCITASLHHALWQALRTHACACLPACSHPDVDQEVAEALLPLLPRAAQQLLQEMGPNGSSNQPLVHIGALVLGGAGQGRACCTSAAVQLAQAVLACTRSLCWPAPGHSVGLHPVTVPRPCFHDLCPSCSLTERCS